MLMYEVASPACRELEPHLIPNSKFTLQVIEESGENPPITGSYRSAGTLRRNPDRSFCQSLLPLLRAWEQNSIPDSPRLLLISRGTRDRLGPSALESPILLDPADVAVDTFAAPGTPSALLAGAEGTVATHVAVGGDGVMELLKIHASLSRN
jgi:hypothetical protein